MTTNVTVGAPPTSEITPGEIAAKAGLTRIGRRPSLPAYLRQIWQRRHFLFELAKSRFVSRNQQDRLGMFWNVLRPCIEAAVYSTVFGLLFQRTDPFAWIAYVTSGVFVYRFSQQTLTAGAKAVTGNLSMIRAMRFPRAVLPMATVLLELFSMVPVVLVLALIVALTGNTPSLSWLLVVPAVLVQSLFNFGMAFTFARITIHVRDFTQLLPFIMRLAFYMSAVFYTLERFPAWARDIMAVNPFYTYISMVRQATLDAYSVSLGTWLIGGAWAVGTLLFGFVFFWRAEERYGRG